MNAIKWAGGVCTLKKDLGPLTASMSSQNDQGTDFYEFERVLRSESKGWFTVRKVTQPTLEQLEKILRNDKAFVLTYSCISCPEFLFMHTCLYIGVSRSGDFFTSVNELFADKAREEIERGEFARRLKKTKHSPSNTQEICLPIAHVLTRTEHKT